MVSIIEAVLSVALVGILILLNRFRLLPSVSNQETVPKVPGALPNPAAKRKRKKRSKEQSESQTTTGTSNAKKYVFTHAPQISHESAIGSGLNGSQALPDPVSSKTMNTNGTIDKDAKSAGAELSKIAEGPDTAENDLHIEARRARDIESDFVPEMSSREDATASHDSGLRVLKIIGSNERKPAKKPKASAESTELTKKQRQNRKKYEAKKEVKAIRQEEQERRLREFKQQRAREAMLEQQRLDAQNVRIMPSTKQNPTQSVEISTSSNIPLQPVEEHSWESVPTRKGARQVKRAAASDDDFPDIPDSRFALPSTAQSRHL
ncbi:hypothetical protein V1525DRAFT_397965 [Lipomyces kononenkoae]|uniref:Uncharacterized protein n=1 Tax=Lipomyces kononenkoae TaxID=34357 RepID=A0ACC3T786_LIPKO